MVVETRASVVTAAAAALSCRRALANLVLSPRRRRRQQMSTHLVSRARRTRWPRDAARQTDRQAANVAGAKEKNG